MKALGAKIYLSTDRTHKAKYKSIVTPIFNTIVGRNYIGSLQGFFNNCKTLTKLIS